MLHIFLLAKLHPKPQLNPPSTNVKSIAEIYISDSCLRVGGKRGAGFHLEGLSRDGNPLLFRTNSLPQTQLLTALATR